ncbi:hypothetical protein [Jiangella alkaliphila]|uniref:HhH-GPD domain-containing protein n=1 Tax=Jiangella alkaliphila TaxID=419479 RepID=A0A1H2GE67_9ACTN|nr:hypothetical protein [Jiangella alkaliphila]SDU17943.1 hypothetical protein SAMN04488563_0451 [Jiangella alkaliphila]
MANNDVQRLVTAIETSLPAQWQQWPGGWPNQIEAALIDAVMSIRARYGQSHTGVRGAIFKWREQRGGRRRLDDLQALTAADPSRLTDVFGRQQLSGGALKGVAIVQAAQNLVDNKVRHAADVDPASARHKAAYTSVRGLGPVTWEYFLMLLGTPGVKADTWITRFVSEALDGRTVTSTEARALVIRVAEKLQVSPTLLDHAIWSHRRQLPR